MITVCYHIFAVQMALAINWRTAWVPSRRKATTAVTALVVVFVFCAHSGYLSSMLPEGWAFFRDALHAVLLFASVVLVVTNQANHIARALDGRSE